MNLSLLIYRKTKLTAQNHYTGVNQIKTLWLLFSFAIARPGPTSCASLLSLIHI